MTLRLATVALLVAGLALMLPFEAWYTRLAGVLCLFGFVACGLFAIATPAYLAGGEGADDRDAGDDDGATRPA